jgi:hypothetical protein
MPLHVLMILLLLIVAGYAWDAVARDFSISVTIIYHLLHHVLQVVCYVICVGADQ